jgi:dienelactone hydrolase
MKILFRCSCGAPYEVDSSFAGKRARCRTCAKEFRIPRSNDAEDNAPADIYGLEDGSGTGASPLPLRRAEPREMPDAQQPRRPASPRKKRASKAWSSGLGGREVSRGAAVGLIVVVLLIVAVRHRGGLSARRSGDWPATLAEARRGFQTHLARRESSGEPVDPPPPSVFRLVHFPSPVGNLAAYLTPDPGDGRKHPAIVWITGGDCNTIGDVWSPAPPNNDQTAAAFRQAGIVTMFPSLRGGNDNPGIKEGFLGEVDDVLAAADFLAREPYVDPSHVYLGGHSTGGTLVLLVAECSDRFRAVFSFGPVDAVSGYSPGLVPISTWDRREVEIRSPGYWLDSVRCPTYVLEGSSRGNVGSLRAMQAATRNPNLHFHVVHGADHFSILAPTNRTLAAKVLEDRGPVANITLGQGELDGPFGR